MEGRHWRKQVLGDKAVETDGADVLLPCGDKVGLKGTHRSRRWSPRFPGSIAWRVWTTMSLRRRIATDSSETQAS